METSLPLVMRKKDSVFIDCDEELDEVRVVHDLWDVSVNGVKITCEIFLKFITNKGSTQLLVEKK